MLDREGPNEVRRIQQALFGIRGVAGELDLGPRHLGAFDGKVDRTEVGHGRAASREVMGPSAESGTKKMHWRE